MDEYHVVNDDINISDINKYLSGGNDPGFVENTARCKDRHISDMIPISIEAAQSTNVVDSTTTGPYVKIIEQPATKAIRFRYGCEGRSAGSIPGISSTSKHKTFPSIKIVGYNGRAVAVVSCVSKDPPYRPHPYSLVGKGTCRRGVCTAEVASDDMIIIFSGLGIQCVKKKDIEEALETREEIRVDPFRTGFDHKHRPSGIDLNSVRLCFQVFIEGSEKGKFTVPLAPVVSDPIYDKKTVSDLAICKLSHCCAPSVGGMEMMLFCEKVNRGDIQVIFFEMDSGYVVWRDYGDFQAADVHKQVGISLKTPAYRTHNISQPVQVFIQLVRPSDGETSSALPFMMIPSDTGYPVYAKRKRQKYSTSGGISQTLHPECINNGVPENYNNNAPTEPQNTLIDNDRMTLLRQLQTQAEKSVAEDATDILNNDLNIDVTRIVSNNLDSNYLDMILSASFDSLLIGDTPENQMQSVKCDGSVAGPIGNNEVWPV